MDFLKLIEKQEYAGGIEMLRSGAEQLGILLSDAQVSALLCFYEMLVEKNKVMNLTGITDFEEVIKLHFLDSLSGAKAGGFRDGISVIDVGTGAGFPGMVLAIAFPKIRFTLVDALDKRVNFLKEVAGEIGLTNVTILHSRAEDLAKDAEHRECYDIAVARAVAALPVLIEYNAAFVRLCGGFIAYKSVETEEEIALAKNAEETLGLNMRCHLKFELPVAEVPRSLVIYEKIAPTPEKYPRRAGVPVKKPL